MAGFTFHSRRDGSTDVLRDDLQVVASGTVAIGDALEFASGKVQRCNGQGDTPEYIALEAATATATSLTTIRCMPTGRNLFKVAITPLVDDLDASSGSTTTAVCVLSAGSTDDLVGGLVYLPQQNATRIISGNTYGGGNVTLTWLEPVTTAVASGDDVRVVPFGPGTRALKLKSGAVHNAISNAIADLTGGQVRIYKVDMKNKFAIVYFRD